MMCSTVEPYSDVEIDQHQDSLRIWATVQKVRDGLEHDINCAIEDLAKTIECVIDEDDGKLYFECEDETILDALRYCEKFINTYKLAKFYVDCFAD